MKSQFLIFTLITSFLYSNYATASLLISPTRIAFGERDRVQTISLVNSSKKTNTYRVEWTEQKVGENGEYIELSEDEVNSFPVASPYLRLTPRQVTLEPGERQVIKVMARRKANMKDLEYRSHLTFTAIPPESNSNSGSNPGISMRLNLLLSYTIPVILRHGKLSVETSIDDIQMTPTDKVGIKKLMVTLSRKGSMSTTGSLQAYFVPEDSNEKVNVATLNGFNFFPDTPKITKNLIWHTPIPETPGKLEVLLEGDKEFKGQILASNSIEFK